MDWILENFGKLLPIILMVLYFWMNARKAKDDDGEEGAGGSHDADGGERTRRIQDEIRRRILERQRGDSPQPVVPPPLLVEEDLHQAQTSKHREVREGPTDESLRQAASLKRKNEASTILEQQSRMADRLEEARRLTAVRDKLAKSSGKSATASAFQRGASGRVRIHPLRKALLGDLASGHGLRRAILLREVLGEPVGMRRNSTFER